MKDKKQVYQNPEIVIQYFPLKDIVKTSDSHLTWDPNWNENDWDNPDNTYIED